jgi:MFS transporter, DHA2 family, multidrug resistance protein
MMFVLLDNGIIFLALPDLTRFLGATSTESLWIAHVYGFMLMGFMVTMGRLGDRVGHRKVLLTGAAAFSVLSIVAAFANSVEMLILLRALMGIAGATLGPCLFALVKRMFPNPRQMATAMSIMATSAMLGVSFGPSVGGLLLNWFWAGSVFLIAVPVMVSLLVIGPIVLPPSATRSSERLDLFSVALWLATVLPVIYGLTELARSGWAMAPLAAIAIGTAVGVVFARRQHRLPEPLLDMRLFGIRAIGATLLMYLLVGIVQSGNGLVLTQHMQLVEGLSPFATSIWMVLPIATAILGVHISTFLAKRYRPSSVLVGGLIVAAVGATVLTQIIVDDLVVLLIGLCVVMLGTSPVGVLSSQLIMQAAPPERAGAAGSLNSTNGELSSALGIAVFGSLMTVLYSGSVTVPDGTSTEDAAAANDTLVQATALAERLPAPAADTLLASAREAFNSGFAVIAAMSAVLFLALAVLVYKTLRSVPPIGAEPVESDPAGTAPVESEKVG